MDEEKKTIGDILAIISSKAIDVVSKIYPKAREKQSKKLEGKVNALENKKLKLEKNIELKERNKLLKMKIKELKDDIEVLKSGENKEKKQVAEKYIGEVNDKPKEDLNVEATKENETIAYTDENKKLKEEINKYKEDNKKLKDSLKKNKEKIKVLKEQLNEIKEKNIETRDVEVDKYDQENKDNPNYLVVNKETVEKNKDNEKVLKGAVDTVSFYDDKESGWDTIKKEIKGEKKDLNDKEIGNTSYRELKSQGDLRFKQFDDKKALLIMDSFYKHNIKFSAFQKENGKVNIAVKECDMEKVAKIVNGIEKSKNTRSKNVER